MWGHVLYFSRRISSVALPACFLTFEYDWNAKRVCLRYLTQLNGRTFLSWYAELFGHKNRNSFVNQTNMLTTISTSVWKCCACKKDHVTIGVLYLASLVDDIFADHIWVDSGRETAHWRSESSEKGLSFSQWNCTQWCFYRHDFNLYCFLQVYYEPMLKLDILTESELGQIFGTLDSLIPLHEGKFDLVCNYGCFRGLMYSALISWSFQIF